MTTLLKTNSTNPDFRALVLELTIFFKEKNGEKDDFYNQFNTLYSINHVIVAYQDGQAVGCGAFKKFEDKTAEIKRMFVKPALRGQGIATQILTALEVWALEVGFTSCILETLKEHTSAVSLYAKNGYRVIPNYAQYIGVESSVYMGKNLTASLQ